MTDRYNELACAIVLQAVIDSVNIKNTHQERKRAIRFLNSTYAYELVGEVAYTAYKAVVSSPKTIRENLYRITPDAFNDICKTDSCIYIPKNKPFDDILPTRCRRRYL